MAPIAITPPAIEVKSVDDLNPLKSVLPKSRASTRPSMKRADTSHMGTKRKIMCFSDFDGTIFHQDTGHILFNTFGCGDEQRKVLDHQIHSGERSFRDVSDEMWGSLDVPFEDGFQVMKDALVIDEDFQTFHEFCRNNDIPFNVISAGLKPVLRRVLDHFLGEEASESIDIVANDAVISEDGSSWKPVWLHETELGHDKKLSMTEARQSANLSCENGTIPLIVFIGDGVSDLPGARDADVLFPRRGLRLEEYCIENDIKHIAFDTFADIQEELIRIAKEDEQQTRGKGMPRGANPRANMWRRASSRQSMPVYKALTPKEEGVFVWPDIFSTLNEAKNAAAVVAEPAAVGAPAVAPLAAPAAS